MKTFVSVVALAITILAFTLTTTAGPGRRWFPTTNEVAEVKATKPAKLPVLKVPKKVNTEEVYISKSQVTYSVYYTEKGEKIYVEFTADHNGMLTGFRVTQGDIGIFGWSEGGYGNNTVITDVEAWKSLFKKGVAFRPFLIEK